MITRILPSFPLWIAAVSLLACTTGAPPPSAPATEPPAAPSASPSAPATVTPPAPSKQGPAGALCGGIAGFGCAAGLYCAFAVEAHCGAADQSGICTAVPEVCAQQFAPVCGCNDKTYPSECEAAREGISIGMNGACAESPVLSEGQTCGTRGVERDCAAGLYCKYKTLCGATDSGGTCTKRPEICTKIYRPVCGCDGKTYPSDCVAASEGTAVSREGECKK